MSACIMRPLRAAVVALSGVLLFGIAGCATKGDRAAAPASSSTAPTPDNSMQTEVSPLERYLDLPIAKYSFTPEESYEISLAEHALVDTCMRKYGLSYHAESASAPATYQPGTNRRYGVLNAAVAARYGYHFPQLPAGPAPRNVSSKELLALNGSPNGTAEVHGQRVPKGGCLGKAKAEVQGKYTYAKGAQVARTIATRSFTESLKEPAVMHATSAWSRCMKDKGFSYRTPLQALGAPENSGEQITKREVTTARADVACKVSTGLVKIWSAREAALQNSMIEKNHGALNSLREAHRKTITEARAIAGGGE
jgi:hypothetical protein